MTERYVKGRIPIGVAEGGKWITSSESPKREERGVVDWFDVQGS